MNLIRIQNKWLDWVAREDAGPQNWFFCAGAASWLYSQRN